MNGLINTNRINKKIKRTLQNNRTLKLYNNTSAAT